METPKKTRSQHEIACQISAPLWDAIQTEHLRTGESISQIVERALANELDANHHSLFQVSTSQALVEGVFSGSIRVENLLHHGDFGLGTFDGLDGEMVILEGSCYQVTAGGTAHKVALDTMVPYATVTRFYADRSFQLSSVKNFSNLQQQLDQLRDSNNLFVAFRIDGIFSNLSLRAACRAEPGEKLVQAIEHQSKFLLDQAEGTLVGFWSHNYSSSISVPGYHFHFLNSARTLGGHVFDLVANDLQVEIHQEMDIHLAIPETAEFLAANLQRNSDEALAKVEKPPT